jgi:hypothetical protein
MCSEIIIASKKLLSDKFLFDITDKVVVYDTVGHKFVIKCIKNGIYSYTSTALFSVNDLK